MSLFLKLMYPFFFFLGYMIPRDKNLWVFGNQKHYFDNTRYFFEYVSDLKGDVVCYWLANDDNEVLEVSLLGYYVVKKKSLKGFWLSSRAGFSFICNGFSDVNRFLALDSVVINFWHGTPIKKIYLDSKYDLMKFGCHPLAIKLFSFLMRALNAKVDFYYASNEFEREIVTGASGIPFEKSIAIGAPRFDVIRNAERTNKLPDGKIILYAPTWRENKFSSQSFYLTDNEYKTLTNYLEANNSYLLVKPHPLTSDLELKKLGLKESERVVYADTIQVKDISMLYAHCEVLITDLSSSMFDYFIFNRPVLVFMPDVEEYLKGDRGIYDYFEEVYNYENVFLSWGQVVEALQHQRYPSFSIIEDVAKEISEYKYVNDEVYADLKRRFF